MQPIPRKGWLWIQDDARNSYCARSLSFVSVSLCESPSFPSVFVRCLLLFRLPSRRQLHRFLSTNVTSPATCGQSPWFLLFSIPNIEEKDSDWSSLSKMVPKLGLIWWGWSIYHTLWDGCWRRNFFAFDNEIKGGVATRKDTPKGIHNKNRLAGSRCWIKITRNVLVNERAL